MMRRPPHRRGVVLIAVLVVVAMLALTAYTFSHFVVVENDLSVSEVRRAQARLSGESAVQLVVATIAARQRGESVPDLYDNPEYFGGRKLRVDALATGLPMDSEDQESARATVFVRRFEGQAGDGQSAPASTSGRDAAVAHEPPIRFGIEREGGRIHLTRWQAVDPEALRRALLALPKANESLVDALLDWLDADDDARPAGAERRDYENQPLPTLPRNGPPSDLDELLAVRGMTRDIWFGSRDGREPGWRQFLTIRSRERNADRNGAPRLWLNDPDLDALASAITKEFDQSLADFVRAFRSQSPNGRTFRSVWEIVDGVVVVDARPTESPYRSTDAALSEKLPLLLDRLTATSAPEFVGRLDLSSASPAALELLPLSQPQKQAMLERRPIRQATPAAATSSGPTLSERAPRPPETLAWLLVDHILTLEEIIAIEPHVTASSPVVRFETVGFFDGRREAVRTEFVVDASAPLPRVVERHPHGPFGIGLSLDTLGQRQQAPEILSR